MADCSKTKEFLQEWSRLCKYNICGERCSDVTCPIEKACDGRYSWCYQFMKNCPDEVINLVQKWSDEHPIKTRQTEFLKLFPNSRMRHCDKDYLVLDVCPAALDNRFSCEEDITCVDCQKDYWLSEVD